MDSEMETETVNHYRLTTKTFKATIALGVERCPATNPSVSSALYLLGVKFQLVTWALLNNRFDALVGPALALFKFVLVRRTQTIKRDEKC
jgi:hypothetical protein